MIYCCKRGKERQHLPVTCIQQRVLDVKQDTRVFFCPGGVLQEKAEWGCAARFPKSLTYLLSKSAIFPTLFMT